MVMYHTHFLVIQCCVCVCVLSLKPPLCPLRLHSVSHRGVRERERQRERERERKATASLPTNPNPAY